LTLGLFLTPYGVTSLAEYFAESFEYYLLKDPGYVKKISPACYKVVQDLAEGE
jgi:Mlc titration factor MtfA (ptsG expression regulator)